MTDPDDLLRGWAEDTDPERDPITVAEVQRRRIDVDLELEPPRSQRRLVLVAAGVAAAVLICAVIGVVLANRDAQQPVRTDSTTPVAPLGEGVGRLVVTNTIGDRAYADMGPLPPDGLVALTQVLHGADVVAETRGWGLGDRTVLDESLRTGTYLLRSWETVTCDEQCGPFDDRDLVDPSQVGDQPLESACTTEVTVRAGLTTTVQMRQGLDDPDDNRACGFAVGTPTRVVLATSFLSHGFEGGFHRFDIVRVDDGSVVAGGPVARETTQLVLDQPVAPGNYELRFENYDCPGFCPDVDPDGRPTDGQGPSGPIGDCEVAFAVNEDPSQVVVSVADAFPSVTCSTARTQSPLPPLTVPPAWSLQVRLPTTCGTDYLHRAGIGSGEGGTVDAEAAKRCFLDAQRNRAAMELYVIERSRLVIWRTRGGRFEVVRPGPTPGSRWTRQACDLIEAPGAGAAATGCGRQRTMPLQPQAPD